MLRRNFLGGLAAAIGTALGASRAAHGEAPSAIEEATAAMLPEPSTWTAAAWPDSPVRSTKVRLSAKTLTMRVPVSSEMLTDSPGWRDALRREKETEIERILAAFDDC